MSQPNSEGPGSGQVFRPWAPGGDSPSGAGFFVDGHVDLPFFLMKQGSGLGLGDLDEGPFTLEKARGAGVRLFCTAIYCEDKFNGQGSLSHLKGLLDFVESRYDRVKIIRERAALQQLGTAEEEVGTLFLLENADALCGNTPFVEEFKERGIIIVGLTHVGKNRLADGNAVRFSDGLTPQGKEVVEALDRWGIVVDVAHLHPKCFNHLLDLTRGPVVSSHTGIREVCDTRRNISLGQAREVFERGGVVGITFNPEMLSPDGTAGLEDVFAHVDTVVQKFGPEGVGIGSDFCGFDSPARGIEDITRIGDLAEMLLDHGYGREHMNGIMGGNWLRFYNSCLEGRG